MFKSIKSFFGKAEEKQMLTEAMRAQLEASLEKLQQPVELTATLDDTPKSRELLRFLNEVAAISDTILLCLEGNAQRKPSFSVGPKGDTPRIHFAGIPTGHEFASLALALQHGGGDLSGVDPGVIAKIQGLNGPLVFDTYITMSCHNCPDGIQALNLMAAINPGISHSMVDGNMFLSEINQHGIKVVPTIFLNGEFLTQGKKGVNQYLDLIEKSALQKPDPLP